MEDYLSKEGIVGTLSRLTGVGLGSLTKTNVLCFAPFGFGTLNSHYP